MICMSNVESVQEVIRRDRQYTRPVELGVVVVVVRTGDVVATMEIEGPTEIMEVTRIGGTIEMTEGEEELIGTISTAKIEVEMTDMTAIIGKETEVNNSVIVDGYE